MSELISGKEALIALANGEDVLYINTYYKEKPTSYWGDAKECIVEQFFNGEWLFKMKPRTITLNNIEVPAPFELNEFEDCYMLSDLYEHGYTKTSWKYSKSVPAWRTEEEIKQVVSALRSVFKGGV
ncbi:MAG: hypothetical protein RSA09_00200 [Acinetobacter sp.]